MPAAEAAGGDRAGGRRGDVPSRRATAGARAKLHMYMLHVAVKSDNFRNTYTTFTIRPWALRNSYILSTYGTLYRTLNQVASFTFHPHPPAMLTVASCGAGTI